MSNNIIFLDVDGPLIPHRMYYGGGRPIHQNGFFIWDPIAVAMINHLTNATKAKIVFNTMHNENGGEIMKFQAEQNRLENVDQIPITNFETIYTKGRAAAIYQWLQIADNTDRWIVIDDMDVGVRPNQIYVDYNVGLTIDNFAEALNKFDVQYTVPTFISNVK